MNNRFAARSRTLCARFPLAAQSCSLINSRVSLARRSFLRPLLPSACYAGYSYLKILLEAGRRASSFTIPGFYHMRAGGLLSKGEESSEVLIKPETNLGVAQPFLTPNHFKTQRVLIIHGKDIIMEYFNLYPYIVLILKETFTAKYNGVLPRTP